MRVLTPQEMLGLETRAREEFLFDETLIIENVGAQGAEFILRRVLWQSTPFKEIIFLIGQGNNGADALAIARHLTNRGRVCRAFLLFPDEVAKRPPLAQQARMAQAFGVRLTEVREVAQLSSYFTQAQERYVVVDGIFGTGLKLPISQYLFETISIINRHATVTVSVDIPSGITGASGQKSSAAIRADHTLAIAAPKKGLFGPEAQAHVGELTVLDAGLPTTLLAGGDKFLLTDELVRAILPARDRLAHKGSFGHVLLVGGSPGLTGAVAMASQAALRSGCGLVTAATWAECLPELLARLPMEAMNGVIPPEEGDMASVLRDMNRYSALVLGPGLGRSERARPIVLNALMSYEGPLVLDADALNALTFRGDADLLRSRRGPTVLTPHMGELARFLEVPIKKLQKRPTKYLKRAVDGIGQAVVLKGPCTYVGMPNGNLYIGLAPNDGMAKGGSGDVLAGLMGGMLAEAWVATRAKGVESALAVAVWAHARAGLLAARKFGTRGMRPGDVLSCLPAAFGELDVNPDQKNNHRDGKKN